MRSGLVLFLACGLLFGCGGRTGTSAESGRFDDETKPQAELKLELPAYPQERDLIEFSAGPTGSHRYFVDGKTLSIGKDGVVRYSVVVRTSGGAINVSYEGIRCSSAEKRIYAIGARDKTWVEAKRSDWEPIRRGVPNDHYREVLYTEYFCPERVVIPDRDTMLRALRSGERASEMQGSHL